MTDSEDIDGAFHRYTLAQEVELAREDVLAASDALDQAGLDYSTAVERFKRAEDALREAEDRHAPVSKKAHDNGRVTK